MTENINGLYKDEDGKLWVVVHLDDEDLLEWGEDLSYQYNLPEHTIISSENSDFLDIKYAKEMTKINDIEYDCIEYPYDCWDYAYIDKTKLEDTIMANFKNIKNYSDLRHFVKMYNHLI